MSTQLAIAGVSVAVPTSAAVDPVAIFSELGTKFKWHDAVTQHLTTKCQFQDLEDFAYAFTDRGDAMKLVDKIRDCPEELRLVQAGRLARAWEGIKEALTESKAAKAKDLGSDPDMDKVLDQKDLDSLDDQFWARVKIVFPPTVEPSDYLKSRLHREIARRLLSLREVWGVRTLEHQSRSKKRREEVAPNLVYVSEGDDVEADYERSVSQYLRCLRTLLIGYAKGGARPLPTAPTLERRGDDSTQFVEVPYDVVLKYYYRAERQVMKVNPSEQLSWLTAADEAERSEWVEVYRNTGLTLGQTIKTVYIQREAMWQVAPEKRAVPASSHNLANKRQRAAEEVAVPRGWASEFRDGRKVCIKWNQGFCGNECPDGALHCCAKMLGKDRVCGLRSHRAMNCNVGKGRRFE